MTQNTISTTFIRVEAASQRTVALIILDLLEQETGVRRTRNALCFMITMAKRAESIAFVSKVHRGKMPITITICMLNVSYLHT